MNLAVGKFQGFGVLAILMFVTSAFAQDILLSDFEETNYIWLAGGT